MEYVLAIWADLGQRLKAGGMCLFLKIGVSSFQHISVQLAVTGFKFTHFIIHHIKIHLAKYATPSKSRST